MKKYLFLLAVIVLSSNYVDAKTNVPKIVDVQHYTDKILVTFVSEDHEKKIYIESFDDEEIMDTAGYAFSIFQGISESEICLESHHGNAYKEYTIMCYTYDISENDWIHTYDMLGSYYELSDTGDYKIKDDFIYYKADSHEGLYNPNKNYDTNRFLATPIEIENFLKTKLQLKGNIFISSINLVKCIKAFPITDENISLYADITSYLQKSGASDEAEYLLEQIKKFKNTDTKKPTLSQEEPH